MPRLASRSSTLQRDSPACVSTGFGADRGQVAAADDWGGDVRFKTVQPSRPDSWEQVFLLAGRERSLTRWRNDSALAAALDIPRLERAIGVIYRPETGLRSPYFEARLGAQFDAWVWFEQTGPVTPSPGAAAEGAPETYPFGL